MWVGERRGSSSITTVEYLEMLPGNCIHYNLEEGVLRISGRGHASTLLHAEHFKSPPGQTGLSWGCRFQRGVGVEDAPRLNSQVFFRQVLEVGAGHALPARKRGRCAHRERARTPVPLSDR